jgi:hypothetical protein
MEADRAYNCIVNTEEKYQGTEAEGFTANSKSHFMDFANRCSLEGFATAVSAIPDMPSALLKAGFCHKLDLAETTCFKVIFKVVLDGAKR